MALCELSLRSYEDEVLWTMSFPLIRNPDDAHNDPLVLGLLYAGLLLIHEAGIMMEYYFEISVEGQENEMVNGFRLFNDYETPLTARTHDLPRPGRMFLWIWFLTNPAGEYWKGFDPLENEMPRFLQGFISMCNAFKIDFRRFILRPPTDSNGTQYDLPAYRLKEYFHPG